MRKYIGNHIADRLNDDAIQSLITSYTEEDEESTETMVTYAINWLSEYIPGYNMKMEHPIWSQKEGFRRTWRYLQDNALVVIPEGDSDIWEKLYDLGFNVEMISEHSSHNRSNGVINEDGLANCHMVIIKKPNNNNKLQCNGSRLHHGPDPINSTFNKDYFTSFLTGCDCCS